MQRTCPRVDCLATFFLCTHCDRGHRYCSPACSARARREQRRRANQRHQRSPEGRLDHRDRQRDYRRRCQDRSRVTDHRAIRQSVSTHAIKKVEADDLTGSTRPDPSLFCAEHLKVGTIARELNVHPDAVRNAIESEKFKSSQPLRASVVGPYLGLVQQVLEEHPRLRATRIHAMIRDRGDTGSVGQLRRAVARLRPQPREAFL